MSIIFFPRYFLTDSAPGYEYLKLHYGKREASPVCFVDFDSENRATQAKKWLHGSPLLPISIVDLQEFHLVQQFYELSTHEAKWGLLAEVT